MRAQLLLATLREPPKSGSLRELVLRLLIMMKEEAEFLKWRALAVLLIDHSKGAEAFDAYTKAAFPYIEQEKSREKEDLLAMLRREVSRGPLTVKKVEKPKARSRLQASYDRNAARSDKVLSRIGATIPIGRTNDPTGNRKAGPRTGVPPVHEPDG